MPKEQINAMDFQDVSSEELLKMVEELGVLPGNRKSRITRQDLMLEVIKSHISQGVTVVCGGVVEVLKEGFAFARSITSNYISGVDDIYIPRTKVKKYSLSTGDEITGILNIPKNDERYCSLYDITTINGRLSNEHQRAVHFNSLKPVYPDSHLKLECDVPFSTYAKNDVTARAIDIVAPLGAGQRALIVAPPRTGKTMILQNIAHSISVNHPNMLLMVLLIGERPEEVTDMERSVRGEVISSTFDAPAHRHVQLAELVIEKARRMVECGQDVVILIDSITRLARAYNAVVPSSGKVLSGGVDSNALQFPKGFFGAARNIEGGGSLTIVGTALVDDGSRMDDVIFEEFKGTGNSEIMLDRKLADKRVFPAIDILKSGTRREELLYDKSILSKMWILRRILAPMGTVDAMEFLQNKLSKTKNNYEFFGAMTSTS